MGEEILKRDPDERQDEERKPGEGLRDFCGREREKGPVQSQKEHEQDINEDAEAQGQVAIVGRDRRNPVHKHGIECESSRKSQEEGMLGFFFQRNGQKRDEGDPGEKGKIELRIRESSEHPAQQG